MHARVLSDPTFYQHADEAAKVAVEIALAEEKLKMYFSSNYDIVPQGAFPATIASASASSATTKEFFGGVELEEIARLPGVRKWGTVELEQTRVWHVVDRGGDEGIKGVYVYAHVEAEKGMGFLTGVLGMEMGKAEREGRLRERERRAFGVVQAGMGVAFFEYCGELVGLECRTDGVVGRVGF